MSSNLKIAKVSVYCPFSFKNEIVFIHYILKDNKLYFSAANGCESKLHACPECNGCLADSLEKFKASFSKD